MWGREGGSHGDEGEPLSGGGVHKSGGTEKIRRQHPRTLGDSCFVVQVSCWCMCSTLLPSTCKLPGSFPAPALQLPYHPTAACWPVPITLSPSETRLHFPQQLKTQSQPEDIECRIMQDGGTKEFKILMAPQSCLSACYCPWLKRFWQQSSLLAHWTRDEGAWTSTL